jgi:hypothetical protein
MLFSIFGSEMNTCQPRPMEIFSSYIRFVQLHHNGCFFHHAFFFYLAIIVFWFVVEYGVMKRNSTALFPQVYWVHKCTRKINVLMAMPAQEPKIHLKTGKNCKYFLYHGK